MAKITYDTENSEHCQILNDYYFVMYYMKLLLSDWKNSYSSENIETIIKHQNKCEFKRFIDLCDLFCKDFYYNKQRCDDYVYDYKCKMYIREIFLDSWYFKKVVKYAIYEYFNKNK